LKKIFGETNFIIFLKDQALATLTLIAILISTMIVFALLLSWFGLLVQKFSKLNNYVEKIKNIICWSMVIKSLQGVFLLQAVSSINGMA
jgi:hypothetical protein